MPQGRLVVAACLLGGCALVFDDYDGYGPLGPGASSSGSSSGGGPSSSSTGFAGSGGQGGDGGDVSVSSVGPGGAGGDGGGGSGGGSCRNDFLDPGEICLVPQTYQMTPNTMPRALAIGLLDADPYPDVAVALANSSDVAVFSGQVGGTFAMPPTYFDTGSANKPKDVVIGYLDDGLVLDLLVVAENGADDCVVFLPGPAFLPTSTICSPTTGAYADAVAVVAGNLTDSADDDIAVLSNTQNHFAVARDNGTPGSFDEVLNTNATFPSPGAIALIDFDGSLNHDVVVASDGPPGRLTLFKSNGSESFDAGYGFEIETGPHAIALGLFDGDPHLDVAVTNRGSGSISILGNDTGDALVDDVVIDVASQPTGIAAANFDSDADGHIDLAVAHAGVAEVWFLPGDGTLGFEPAVVESNPDSGAVDAATADLNADGVPDLVVVNETDASITVFLSTR